MESTLMTISRNTLDRLRSNDSTLTSLILTYSEVDSRSSTVDRKLTDDDIRTVVDAMRDNTNLTYLCLTGHLITDVGATYLASFLPHTVLKLDLGCNSITATGAISIIAGTRVQSLGVHYNKLNIPTDRRSDLCAAFDANRTICEVNVFFNKLEDVDYSSIIGSIYRNNQAATARLNQQIATLTPVVPATQAVQVEIKPAAPQHFKVSDVGAGAVFALIGAFLYSGKLDELGGRNIASLLMFSLALYLLINRANQNMEIVAGSTARLLHKIGDGLNRGLGRHGAPVVRVEPMAPRLEHVLAHRAVEVASRLTGITGIESGGVTATGTANVSNTATVGVTAPVTVRNEASAVRLLNFG